MPIIFKAYNILYTTLQFMKYKRIFESSPGQCLKCRWGEGWGGVKGPRADNMLLSFQYTVDKNLRISEIFEKYYDDKNAKQKLTSLDIVYLVR